jgi:hypothetical protein
MYQRHCFVPYVSHINANSFTVNIWWRQWDTALKEQAIQFARQTREAANSEACKVRSQIEDAMLRLSKELQAYVTVGFSYSLLGGGLQMLEADEVLARLEKLVTWTSNTLQSPMPTQSVACAIMIFQLGIQGRQTELCTTGGGGGASPTSHDDFIRDCTGHELSGMDHIYCSPWHRARLGSIKRVLLVLKIVGVLVLVVVLCGGVVW